MGRKKGQQSQDAMRRFQQGSARRLEAEAKLLRSLQDPAEFSRALSIFGQLALVLPSLVRLRFPIPAFVEALVQEARQIPTAPGAERLPGAG